MTGVVSSSMILSEVTIRSLRPQAGEKREKRHVENSQKDKMGGFVTMQKVCHKVFQEMQQDLM